MLAAADGGVFAFPGNLFHGSAASLHLSAPVVGIAETNSGAGYWLVGADGGVFNYGDAPFLGSMGQIPLNAPVVGIQHLGDRYGVTTAKSGSGLSMSPTRVASTPASPDMSTPSA